MVVLSVNVQCSKCDATFDIPWKDFLNKLWIGPRKMINNKWEQRFECEICCPTCQETIVKNINPFF